MLERLPQEDSGARLVRAGRRRIPAGQLLGTQSLPRYDPGQAGRGEQILHQLDVVTPPSESVLIQPRGPAAVGLTFATDPQMRQAARQVAAALRALPGAAEDISSPSPVAEGSKTAGDPPGGLASGAGGSAVGLVAAGGGSALVTFEVAGPHADADATVAADQAAVARVQAAHPDLVVAEAGDASADAAANALLASDFHMAELTSAPITLMLLLVVFGALIAAEIPVLLAGSAVTGTISLLAIASRWLPIGSGTAEVVLILGMAVGVDYSLFYLRRERGARGRTFGRRCAADCGGYLGPCDRDLRPDGGHLAGRVAAQRHRPVHRHGSRHDDRGRRGCGWLSDRAASDTRAARRQGRSWPDPVPRPTAARSSRLWAVLVRRVVRHPLAWGGIAVIAMLALAAPALGMRVGNPVIDLPSGLPVVQTLDEISHAFPGRPAPAEVVVTGRDLASPRVRRAVVALEDHASASGPVRGPVTSTAVAGTAH